MKPFILTTVVLAAALAGCDRSDVAARADESGRVCELVEEPAYPSPEWTEREAANFAKVSEAPASQAQDPDFMLRWQEQSAANRLEYEDRRLNDPYWNSGENVCAYWSNNCTGDPYRYPGTDPFYDSVGEVIPVNFYDAGGARLNGRVWSPRSTVGTGAAGPGGPAGAKLPAVVIINGSVQAPETLYWWAAQMLVENGYLVMTFDPRGQGRSDSATPDGERGTNINSTVFRTNLIDAVDFFYSTPSAPYAHNLPGSPGYEGDAGAAATTAFNPFHERFDRSRLGVAGHSLGATGVSVVQGEQPWAGHAVAENPIRVAVAWDNVSVGELDGVAVTPRVPMMGQSGDYFLAPTPNTQPPAADAKNAGFRLWVERGLPAVQIQVQGGTHYEWSLLPQFPTTDWIPGEAGGWGQPMVRHYTLAWFDRWLKKPGEPGYDTADARLMADADWRDRMSFYYPSQRSFPMRDGTHTSHVNIRNGC